MSEVYVSPGHNLSTLVPLIGELTILQYPTFQKEATTDGILRNRGGATASLRAVAYTIDEAIATLNQFGLSIDLPSAYVTVVFPDYHDIPTPFYGVVTIEVSERQNGWWRDFTLQFTGLRKVT